MLGWPVNGKNSVPFTTKGPQATSNVGTGASTYQCTATAPFAYAGVESFYEFSSPLDAAVTVSWSVDVKVDNCPDLRPALIVIEDTGHGCRPNNCVVADRAHPTVSYCPQSTVCCGFDPVTFNAKAGKKYYIGIDTYNWGASYNASISVSCSY